MAAAMVLLCSVRGASAHRLDEYLQATILTVEKDHVAASMRLIPGVSVASQVIASIDSNSDGVLSAEEQKIYAERVLDGLTISADGVRLHPKLVSADFPTVELMREGLGEIHLELTAELPLGGSDRRLVLENRSGIGKTVYLVNCLVPQDRDIRVLRQVRNADQSRYELDYTEAGVVATPAAARWMAGARWWLNSVGFASLFQLGIRHIAEGTDHLLFLLALLLPAPLIAVGARWSGCADVRHSLMRILKVVTAFTVGHSITLGLAAMGFVRVPGRPIEVLIAVSIVVSAVHALRPIFPGKEAWIAAFFGLIHGLAFAATLDQLGLGRWERVAGILAFNLGIETMQLAVVAATLPSLLLMSRTRAYPWLRVGGACFAGMAALGWIVERVLGLNSSVDVVVNGVARFGCWIACALFSVSLGCWLMRFFPDRESPATAPS
jgi:hypothetical protein